MEGYLLVGSNGVHLAALAHTNVGAARAGRDFKGAVGADDRFTAKLALDTPCSSEHFTRRLQVPIIIVGINRHTKVARYFRVNPRRFPA